MYFFVDSVFYKNEELNVIGWIHSEHSPERARLSLTKNGQEVPFDLSWGLRPDAAYAYFQDANESECGFFITAPAKKSDKFTLTGREYQDGELLDEKSFDFRISTLKTRELVKSCRLSFRRTYRKLDEKIRPGRYEHVYTMWHQRMQTAPYELEQERREAFPDGPKFSILTPVFRTPVRYLREMVSSVLNQSYGNFELILVNADPTDEGVRRQLTAYQAADPRVIVKELERNEGIAENTNAALALASGDFIALLDHDDTLEYDALYQYAKQILSHPETDLLYCDEDKMKVQTDYYFYPNFKPDYDPDMLFSNNYICHFLSVRRSLAIEAGGFCAAFDNAQDYDFILKCTEKARSVAHIPKVLYHWRTAKTSASRGMKKKQGAVDAGARAIAASYERRGIRASVTPAKVGGWYETKFELQDQPLISVLIPNKDHTEDLDACIRSLMTRATYKNLEILVIENNSEQPETFRYYEALQQEFPAVRVIYYQGGFNYSAINNFGAREAKGDVLLLLNNDTELITEDLFESMLGYLQRADVGIVGAKLLYADNTVQHAGVLTGAGGLADHMFKGVKDSEPGYMCRAVMSYDVSCVTAACLMVKKDVYFEVGGLEEDLAVAFNDVDFCLKVQQAGYYIVYDAQAKMHHYESKSRGAENTKEKFLRAGRETLYLSEKWKIYKDFTDPFYNPNLSYLNEYFKLNERKGLIQEQVQRERFLAWAEEGKARREV